MLFRQSTVMRIQKVISLIGQQLKPSRREKFEKAATVTVGTAAAVWVVLRLRRELYGPGGTQLSRYDPKVDEMWEERRRSGG
jgi:hypothetical protein